ncbi:hypothetical protein JKF63_07369 [Porcisia hertigi]|uniref:Calcineurin-like phosphoesterase domain-containing protein n=1 Tax=Porcisia hertigi TaxID=2761500 RepID=A0A836LKT7_9TRYP|nr:hypothetical protein JKF63_07369 [Porcisia hertigi]
MFRKSMRHCRRISYITDVEGDFLYFQRFVCLSRVLQWEPTTTTVSSGSPRCTTGESNSGSNTAPRVANSRWAPLSSALLPAASKALQTSNADPSIQTLNTTTSTPTLTTNAASGGYETGHCHLVDLSHYRLGFRDATSHFVFGGDAFDHGSDITIGKALLDLKHRFPSRVHLILGNRDINKMAMYPQIAREVDGMAPDAAEDALFTLPPPLKDAVPGGSLKKPLRYRDFLRKRQQQQRQAQHQAGASDAASSPRVDDDSVSGGTSNTLCADPVSFLEWALENKFGGPNTFAHRRQELREIAAMTAEGSEAVTRASPEADTGTLKNGGATTEDAMVAASFFTSAQPGGVYYEYIRAGVLSVVLDGVLFLHGGVNGDNTGFVPSLEATSYAEQIIAGKWWLPEVAPQGIATASGPPLGTSALDWLTALEEFKEKAFSEWANGTASRGEALRAYAHPRFVAPHSIVVGTVMDVDGPHHIPLTVVAYLLQSGIHTVCTGHQPVGDTPAIVREPGGFMIIDADNSYCGRGNEFSMGSNQRGAAVMELLFEHPAADGDDDGNRNVAAHNAAAVPSLIAHGYRADGTPFEFDVYGDRRIGRYVGDGWWVRLPPEASTHAGLYELRRTQNGFRDEETRWATATEIDEWLRDAAASGQAMVPGELPRRYSTEELAEVRPHRLKTKVKRT